MVFPDYSGNGGGGGQSGGDIFKYSVNVTSGNVSLNGYRYFIWNKWYFSEKLPEKTFYANDSTQIIDPVLIEKVKNATTASLDITFETFHSIDETRALAKAYDVDLIWMPFDYFQNIQLGLADQPTKSDAEIRMMFLTLIQNEKYVSGHEEFKDTVKVIFSHDFRIIGFRVSGKTENLLSLLNDPLVRTFRIDKLNGIDLQK